MVGCHEHMLTSQLIASIAFIFHGTEAQLQSTLSNSSAIFTEFEITNIPLSLVGLVVYTQHLTLLPEKLEQFSPSPSFLSLTVNLNHQHSEGKAISVYMGFQHPGVTSFGRTGLGLSHKAVLD